jgi:uncharacterized protein (TIGR00251 family)
MPCQFAVRVTPRSAKPGIGGWRASSNGREELEIRVSEAPTDGSANAAVVKLLAKALGVSKSEVEIVAGLTSRHKRIAVAMELDEVVKRLGS